MINPTKNQESQIGVQTATFSQQIDFQPKVVEKIVEKIVEKPITKIQYVDKIIEKPVTVEKIVYVDKPVNIIQKEVKVVEKIVEKPIK